MKKIWTMFWNWCTSLSVASFTPIFPQSTFLSASLYEARLVENSFPFSMWISYMNYKIISWILHLFIYLLIQYCLVSIIVISLLCQHCLCHVSFTGVGKMTFKYLSLCKFYFFWQLVFENTMTLLFYKHTEPDFRRKIKHMLSITPAIICVMD